MKWLFAIGACCLLVVFIQRADWSRWPAYAVSAWVLIFVMFGAKGFKDRA